MLGQPRFKLAVGFDFFLQCFQGVQLGRKISTFGGFGIDGYLLGAAVFVKLGYGISQLLQSRLRFLL